MKIIALLAASLLVSCYPEAQLTISDQKINRYLIIGGDSYNNSNLYLGNEVFFTSDSLLNIKRRADGIKLNGCNIVVNGTDSQEVIIFFDKTFFKLSKNF